jgi:hypothetical protein
MMSSVCKREAQLSCVRGTIQVSRARKIKLSERRRGLTGYGRIRRASNGVSQERFKEVYCGRHKESIKIQQKIYKVPLGWRAGFSHPTA